MVQKQRLYFLVMYNISEIQKGIQAGHAQQEYCNKYFETPEFQQWAQHDKTWMVMNGGTSNQSGANMYNYDMAIGSMEMYLEELKLNNIKCAAFNEPDLNNATSAIAFLVGEKSFDKVNYPDPDMSDFKKLIKDFDMSPGEYDLELGKKLKEMYEMTDEEVYLRILTSKLRFA